jgi:hypothetical protein
VLQVHKAGQAVHHSTCWSVNDVAPQLEASELGATLDNTWLAARCFPQLDVAVAQVQLQKVRAWQII